MYLILLAKIKRCLTCLFETFSNVFRETSSKRTFKFQTNVKYPRQKDSYNCGIFVLYFIQEILKGNQAIISNFDADNFRKKLQVDCIKKSLNIHGRCLVCGQAEVGRKTDWVHCITCKKWTHLNCLNHLNKTKQQIEDDYFIYNCDLCSRWLTSNE